MSRHLVREGARSYECGGPGTVACCAECAGYDPVAALRDELATVAAERDQAIQCCRECQRDTLEIALSETKAALEEARNDRVQLQDELAALQDDLNVNRGELVAALSASRAETAAATARIAELESLFQQTHGVHSSWVARGDQAETALRELRERVRDAVNHRNWGDVLEAISERQ